MSAFALFCIIVGLLIMVTRAPLVFAPESMRDFIYQIIGTEQRIRMFGIFVAVFGALAIWISNGVPGLVAQIFLYIGLFMIAVGALYMASFPAKALALTTKVWNTFSPMAMRAMGLFAVALGAALAYYGWTL